MRKISEIIHQVVLEQPFLELALRHSFLNLTAFSEYIQSYVRKEAGKNVSVHAIKMALSRMKVPEEVTAGYKRNSFKKVSSRMGLSILTLSRTPRSLEILTELMISARTKITGFFTTIEGIQEIDIIYESEGLELFYDAIPSSLKLLSVDNLGLISIELSDKEISTPGLFYDVTKSLAFHGVNIVQVLSTYHELGIIVAEEDMKKAFTVLID